MKFEFQYSLRFRTDTVFALPALIVPFLIYFFLWKTLLGEKGMVSSYSLRSLVTYYLITGFLYENSINAWNEIFMTIKNGEFTYFLLKPLNHYLVYFVRPFAFRTTRLFITSLALVPIIFIFKKYILPPNSITSLFLALLFWFLGDIFKYSIGYLLNILSFFIENPLGFIRFYWFGFYFLSGSMIPLDLLKGSSVFTILPFQYLAYFPAKLYLGQVSGEEVLIGFVVMSIWIILISMVVKFTYSEGLKKYKAPGG